MGDRFHVTPKNRKLLIIGGGALTLLIGITVVITIAVQPERKTCQEWMAHALDESDFESNIGPACLWGDTDPDKAYTLEELEDISQEMEASGEGKDFGGVLPEDEPVETEESMPAGHKMCEDWLLAPEDEVCQYYEDLMNEPVTEDELQVFIDYHDEYNRCVKLTGEASTMEEYESPEFVQCDEWLSNTSEPSLEELRNQED